MPRAYAGSLLAPYRHAWLPLLPTEPVGARTALGTAERRWEAGLDWSSSRQGQAPALLPALLSHQGCRARRVRLALTVQGALSPPANNTCSGSGWWVLESLCSPQHHGCAACTPAPQGCQCRWGWGWVQLNSRTSRVPDSIPWARGHKGGAQSQRAGRAGQSWDMTPHATHPSPTKGTGPSQTHSPRGDQSPVVRTYLLALHALRTSWANAP